MQKSLESYINKYALDYAPHSAKKRNEAIVKFCQGLVDIKVLGGNIAEDYTPTNDECLKVFREFASLWKAIVEEDSAE